MASYIIITKINGRTENHGTLLGAFTYATKEAAEREAAALLASGRYEAVFVHYCD